MTTTAEEQTPEQKDAQVKLEQQEAEQGFAAGFNKVAKKDEATEETTTTTAAAPEQGADKAETQAAQAAEVDPWKDVHPMVRKSLETLQAEVGKVSQSAQSTAGRVGKLQSALDAGKAAAAKAGTDAPSEAQVAAAMTDPNAWKKLEEEFPDFASPVKAELSALRAELAKKTADPELETRVTERVQAVRTELRAEMREIVKIDAKHPDWEATVNTPEFKTWSLQGGPSLERYSQMKALERTDPAKAEQMVNAFARAHPQWWADKGASMFGSAASDAIKLLDGFAGHKKKAADADATKQKQQKRLEGAVTPKGTTSPPTTGLTDEEAFLKGAKKALGGRLK